MDVLDQPVIGAATGVKYSGFWPRVGASILDMLILAPITFGLSYYNVVSGKSLLILIAGNIVAIGYKPFMEFREGATFGKKALNIKVVNLQLEKADLGEVLTRNVFHIAGAVISLFFSIMIFMQPGFDEITGFMDYSRFSQQFKGAQYAQWIIGLITLVDVIMLIADSRKRSLHDRIANTYVIEDIQGS
jgi:uncharacterized RDD family membrane protein YckC